MPLPSGTRIGSYELTAPLGAGGMGEVYRARDPKLERDVAIKILPEAFAADRDRLSRFEREAKTLAALNHPHIAQIYGFEQSDSGSALVMELVEGEDLGERIARGPFPVAEVVPIALQIAEALEAAHERGIIHRDLKPANVKVTPDGSVKVLDFGLAKALDPTLETSAASRPYANSPTITSPAMMTRAGIILGTATYMAPEQAKGKPVDKRADIWAFGCVLYEMLTGAAAFPGETITDVLASIVTREPDFAKLPANTPSTLRQLIARCLEKDPKQRLRDIGEARIALESPLVEPAAAGGTHTAAKSTRLPWVLVAAALLAVIALGARLAVRESSERDGAIWASVMLPEGIQIDLEGGTPGVASISPDGRRLAFSAGTLTGRTQLWVRDLDAPDARALAGTAGAYWPFWSPDGEWIGFFSDGFLRKVSLNGGPVTALAPAPDARGGTWGPDGTIVFAPNQSGPLLRVAAAGGAAAPATTLDESRNEWTHRYPQLLPDGRHVLHLARTARTTARSTARLTVSRVGSSERVDLIEVTSNAFYTSGHLLFAQQGVLMAQPFDPERRRLSGEARPVVEGLLTNQRFSFAHFSASPSGALAFQTGRQSGLAQLVWFDRSGRRLAEVGDAGLYTGALGLAISPDGRQAIAPRLDPATGDSDLWIFDLARNVATRLSRSGSDESNPVFSPDGAWLAIGIQTPLPAPTSRIALIPWSGTGPERQVLRVEGRSFVGPAAFTPDGTQLLVGLSKPDGDEDIGLVPVRGGEVRMLMATPAREAPADLSPDGRWLLYTSDESGRNEVYVTSFPETGRRWQISSRGGREPLWRPDGKAVFFADAENMIVEVDVSMEGSAISVGQARSILQAASHLGQRFTVSPDGQRLLVRVPVEERLVSPITILTNWTAKMRK